MKHSHNHLAFQPAYLGLPHDISGGVAAGQLLAPPLLEPLSRREEDAVGPAATRGAAQSRRRGRTRQEGQLPRSVPLSSRALVVEVEAPRGRLVQRGAGRGERGGALRSCSAALAQQGARRVGCQAFRRRAAHRLGAGSAGCTLRRRFLPAGTADDGRVQATGLAEPPLGEERGAGGSRRRGRAREDAVEQAVRGHPGGSRGAPPSAAAACFTLALGSRS